METIKFGKGIKKDLPDKRDFVFVSAGAFDWDKGYDIEEELNIKLIPKNQFQSESCVSQASSMYMAVLDYIETKKLTEKSAKAIYSQIYLPNGGAYFRDACELLKNWGELEESIVPSYNRLGTTTESFMRDESWLSPTISNQAKKLELKDYKLVTGTGIDVFAEAIRDGYGSMIGVVGNNNGTWLSSNPKPPTLSTPQNELWNHGLYAGKAKIRNGKKMIGVLESWGESIGEDGWQWLGEEYFADNGRWVFNPRVFIDKPNNMEQLNFIQEYDKYIVRNKDNGAYGVIYDRKPMLISAERAGLFMVDRMARNLVIPNLQIQLSNEEFKALPWINF